MANCIYVYGQEITGANTTTEQYQISGYMRTETYVYRTQMCVSRIHMWHTLIIIIIIIYHDFLPPSRRCSHVKSDYAHTIIKHTPLSPYTRHLGHDFQKLSPFHSLSQSHHVTTSHPSPSDNPPERGRAWRKNAWQCKNGHVILNHLHMHHGYPLLDIFRALSRSLQAPLTLCCPRPSSRHPSNLISVYSVLALHFRPPSTSF